MCAVVQGAWAWEGSGTSTDPYLIKTSDDWKEFARSIRWGYDFQGKHFRMTADIDADGATAGSDQYSFNGTFDGDGHTLTYNQGSYDSQQEPTFVDDYCAPFVRLNGATIRHLNVTGSIYSNHMYAAGIASIIDGSSVTTIADCHVSSLLYAGPNLSSDASFGGIAGNVPSTCQADPIIQGCTFNGRIKGNATRSSGLVGYTNRPIAFTDCLFDPQESPSNNECSTLVRMAPGVTCTFAECYYTMKMGTDQGKFIFTEVSVPEGCTAEILGDPFKTLEGKDYYTSGTQVFLTVPEGTPFDHWVTEGEPGCFINDPWTAGGVHTISDVRSQPILRIATSMPAPYQKNRERCGINYRYISNRDYLLFMSDSIRQARNFQFDSDGECYVYDAEGTKNYVTVVWNCDANAETFQNYYREGWFWSEKNYEGSVVFNDLVASTWDHTMLFGIAPRAFLNVKNLKRIVFLSNRKVVGKSDCTAPLIVNIQEQAFKDSGIEELVMMYRNEKTGTWDILGPESGVSIAPDAFEGTNCHICVDPSVYQNYMGNANWSNYYSRMNIYAAKVNDMKVEGAIYSYWRDGNGEALKNSATDHETLMKTLRYWNADYQKFNATSLLSTSSKNIWYTQVIGANDSYLKSNNGVMRIYNDPGSQYNYKTIAINSLGGSKEVKAIEFYQTNGLSDNSYTEAKMVIQNNAFRDCDNLQELRLFYFVEDGTDHWEVLGPEDVIPGDNIFGLEDIRDIDRSKGIDYTTLHKVPEDFKILVATEKYPEFKEDPNWFPYLSLIEPVDFSTTTKPDFTQDGITYGYMSSPGGILQTSQTVSQNISWWTLPRITVEVALLVSSLMYNGLYSEEAEIALDQEALTAQNAMKQAKQTMNATNNAFKKVAGIEDVMCQKMEPLRQYTAFTRDPKKLGETLLSMNGMDFKALGLGTYQPDGDELYCVMNFWDECVDYKTGIFTFTQEHLDKLTAYGNNSVLEFGSDLYHTFINKFPEVSNNCDALEELLKHHTELYNDALKNFNTVTGNLSRMQKYPVYSKFYGALAATSSTAGLIASQCWGGSGTYNPELLNKGMRENILSNIHQVSIVGGGYVITTPNKNIIYHTYIKNISPKTTDAVIYTGGTQDGSNSNRTMTMSPYAFRDNKNLRTVRFHAAKLLTSNTAMPLIFTIPDSAFVGCDNLVEFNTLLQDNDGGTRPLGPENFILAGDSIFAGLDPVSFRIIIDPTRKEDFLSNASWKHLEKYFVYDNAKPQTQYTEYGVEYGYAYERNSIKKENKVNGHLIEHTFINGVKNSWLENNSGRVTLYNDIGQWNNYQLDFIAPWAFKGNQLLRSVKFTDIHEGTIKETTSFDVYTDLDVTLQDSCFAGCSHLETVDLFYGVNDGINHLDVLTPNQIKVGEGVFDNTPARIKMTPAQMKWFEADSAWSAYRDRFAPVVFKSNDKGIWNVLKDLYYRIYDGSTTRYYKEYIDLTQMPSDGLGHYDFSWLDGKFQKQSDDIRSFADFKYFESLGLDYVGKEWFRGCRKLTNIMLPSTIKTIREYAFASCSALQEIELPNGITSIEMCAFADCKDMNTIVVRDTLPAKLGTDAFPKNDGMKIYVPAQSLNDYLKAWAEYKDFIVSDAGHTINKKVKLDNAGTLADKLGLYVEWSYSGLHGGDEPRYIHGNYAKYDSLTVSGPLNDLDLWVIRYLAGNNGYESGGQATDGRLRHLNLYASNIVKDKNCKAHYLNHPLTFMSNGWLCIDKNDELPPDLFYNCIALEDIILPKSITTITKGTFNGCQNLKRIAINGKLKEYDGWQYTSNQLDNPLEELVFLTDQHATSTAKDPWGQPITVVYAYDSQVADYLYDAGLIAQTNNIVSPFKDDEVMKALVDAGEFFPSVYLKRDNVENIFNGRNLTEFDDFQNFQKVKQLERTFLWCSELKTITLPASIDSIGSNAFLGCYNLATIHCTGILPARIADDAFSNLPSDFQILVPLRYAKLYRTMWPQYADHINPEIGVYSDQDIKTVTVKEPNTLATALGLRTVTSFDRSHFRVNLTGVQGDYSNITKLKVVGPIGAIDLDLLRYLSGYTEWAMTPNYLGHLEYIDLYDADIKADDDTTFPLEVRDWHGFNNPGSENIKDNVLPYHAFLKSYSLRTLILPRTCKEVEERALQECEALEILVIGDDMEEFNWNALDDDAMLSRMYILAKKKPEISSQFAVWRWLCNNYNPTFDAFYVRPSQYQSYLRDDAYTGSSWQRTNNISTGIFHDDETFCAFASHGAATADELYNIRSVDGWFDTHNGVKDLTMLRMTRLDSITASTIAPLKELEEIAMPSTLFGMEDGLFKNAKHLRYVDLLLCDSTNIISGLHDDGLTRLGINTQQTLIFVPYTYGPSDGTNIVCMEGEKLYAKTYRMTDSLNYIMPYSFQTADIQNPRTLTTSPIPYTICLPYKLKVPAYARAYKLSERNSNTLVFKEVVGELEAMQPYLIKVVGNKRLRKNSTTLNTDIEQTIPESGPTTYGQQVEVPGYTLRGTFEAIDNQTAAEMGAYILQDDGDWHPVASATDAEKAAKILAFRAFLLPSTYNANERISMMMQDATDIDAIETIDKDGTQRYYDLNGRELPGKPANGIYIHNGKKYMAH